MLAVAVAAACLLLRPAEAYTVSLDSVKLLQSKAAVVRETVETTTLPTTCPVKPSKGDLDCYSSIGFVTTVPGASACVCSNGNLYFTSPSMGACSVANCAVYGTMPMPGSTAVTPTSIAAINAEMFGGPATSQAYGPDSICFTVVVPCNGSGMCPMNIPGAGIQMQGGLNATTVATEDTTLVDTSEASYVTNGCDAGLTQMAGAVSWSDWCNTSDCNKAYQAPHSASSISSGSMRSQTGGVVSGRKLRF